jgi:DNA-binding MarR family transcriptional regulator
MPQRLTYAIGGLDRLLRRHMTDALAPLGITLAQYTALSVLEARGALSNAQLADRSFITPQSSNEVMSVMASRGFVTREADPTHRRVILLRLTAAGAAMLRECEAVLRPLETRMLGACPADTAAQIQRTLELFARNLRT